MVAADVKCTITSADPHLKKGVRCFLIQVRDMVDWRT